MSLIFLTTKIFSQEEPQSCNIASLLCNYDLRNPLPGVIIDSIYGNNAIIYGRSNPSFEDVSYPQNCGVDPNNVVCLTDTSVLKYYVYYASNYASYNSCPLPAVILFHEGSFSDCVTFNNKDIRTVCREFAKRGFVAFDVEYRAGVLVDRRLHTGTRVENTSAQQMLAIYRACQDVRGAIRSIIKRQIHHSDFPNDPYQIDTNNIFLGGMSAGSVIAMNAMYYQSQTQINQISPNTINVMGSINAPWYYGDTTINFVPKVKGVLNMWGGMFIPTNKLSNPASFFVGNTNNPPIISFHGMLDSIFYITYKDVYFSPDSSTTKHINFNTERNCLVNGSAYTLSPNSFGNPDLRILGSINIYNMFQGANIPTELYVDCQMQHGLDQDGPGFSSNFGIALPTNSTAVYQYIVQRACSFFQVVLNSNAGSLVTTHFTECENYRHGCDAADDNAGCCNTDDCTTNCRQ